MNTRTRTLRAVLNAMAVALVAFAALAAPGRAEAVDPYSSYFANPSNVDCSFFYNANGQWVNRVIAAQRPSIGAPVNVRVTWQAELWMSRDAINWTSASSHKPIVTGTTGPSGTFLAESAAWNITLPWWANAYRVSYRIKFYWNGQVIKHIYDWAGTHIRRQMPIAGGIGTFIDSGSYCVA